MTSNPNIGQEQALDLSALRRREVQMMGAAISTRSWHDMETAYNQLRDKIDRKLTRRHIEEREALSTPTPAQVEPLLAELIGIRNTIAEAIWRDIGGERLKRVNFAPSAIHRIDKLIADAMQSIPPAAGDSEAVADALRAALSEGFCVSQSAGHAEPSERRYRLIFNFSNLDALQNAHRVYMEGQGSCGTIHQTTKIDAPSDSDSDDLTAVYMAGRESAFSEAGRLREALEQIIARCPAGTAAVTIARAAIAGSEGGR